MADADTDTAHADRPRTPAAGGGWGRIADRRARPRGESHRLTALGGLAALSLDALSSVAYGPEAIVLALVAAGSAAIRYTVPVSIAIATLLLVLVVSYRQVIAVFPDGGGAYAVAKHLLSRPVGLLAAASLVVDYVLTVAVSLAAGAASLGSVFPAVGRHLLLTALLGLVALTVLNLIGIAESARALMTPALLFVVSVVAVIAVGLTRSHPVAVIGSDISGFPATEALGAVLLLKAFASGCSALTGVEAIANGVPAFRTPRVKRAQHTEVALGVLLGVMLLGLATLIRKHDVAPRGGVTILAQLSAAAFGTGWPFYVSNLAVTIVLGLAANTSFGGLPVLMSLLARDHRLPHVFALRAERPVFRFGVAALAVLAALVLWVVGADTHRLLPVFAIGVFIGFTVSQTGLVRHWWQDRGPGWPGKLLLNGVGAAMTAVAGAVLFAAKFTEGAWLLLVIVPGLILLFDRIERYYHRIATQLRVGEVPPKPCLDADTTTVVIVPVVGVSRLSALALTAAMRMGQEIIPVAVEIEPRLTHRLARDWKVWDPGPPLTVLPSPHRSWIDPLVGFVCKHTTPDREVIVLLPRIEPRRQRHRVLHNQRVPVIAAALRARTDAIVATIVVRVD
ncbi:MAG: APC family permease [Mycobacteriaceae bacterium]|nr:APC family permease [Mycobacteriaceae bacterium]